MFFYLMAPDQILSNIRYYVRVIVFSSEKKSEWVDPITDSPFVCQYCK